MLRNGAFADGCVGGGEGGRFSEVYGLGFGGPCQSSVLRGSRCVRC